jgi:hypothetical protein
VKTKTLVVLIISGFVVAGAAYYLRKPPAAAPSGVGQPVFKDLQVNDITEIVLVSASATTTVAKTEDRWSVPAVYGYPANFEKIRSSLRTLMDLKIQSEMHLDSEQMKDLALVPPSPAATNTGTRIELRGSNSRTIAAFLLGKHHERKGPEGPMSFGGYPDGRYLLLSGNRACRIGETLDDFSTQPRDWLDTDLLNVSGSEITNVVITATNGAIVNLTRDPASDTWKLEGLAADEELDSYKPGSTAGALAYLTFSDVPDPKLTAAQTGLETPTVYTARRKDGRVYTVRIGAASPDGKRYVRLSAEFEAPLPPTPDATEKKESVQAGKGEPPAKAAEDPAADVRALNQRLGPWTYLLESHKTEPMMVTRADLVKKKENSPASETNTAASVPAPATAPGEAEKSEPAQ